MSRPTFGRELPADEQPPGVQRDLERPLQPGEADTRGPPDRSVGFQLEVGAIEEITQRLRALFDLVPLIDQISDVTTDVALALEERRWADFNVAADKLSALASHLVRAIEQRQPRKGRSS